MARSDQMGVPPELVISPRVPKARLSPRSVLAGDGQCRRLTPARHFLMQAARSAVRALPQRPCWPTTWRCVAHSLIAAGHDVVGPDLRDAAAAGVRGPAPAGYE